MIHAVDTPDSPDGCYLWRGARNAAGYGRVYLVDRERILVPRLIWEAVHGPIPDGLRVLHSCDTPLCIRLDHLRLGTTQDNVQDRVDRGRNGRLCGEAGPNARLTTADVIEIRRRVAHGEIQRVVGEQFGIHQVTVSAIVRGQNWSHVPLHACTEECQAR